MARRIFIWLTGPLTALGRRLRFKTKLHLTFWTLTGVITAMAMLDFFGARELDYHRARSELTQDVHKSLLSLESHTYQLFKQMSDAVLVGAPAPAQEREALNLVRADIDQVRRLIAEELKLVGDREDETEELAHLAVIERQIDAILAEYAAVLREMRAEPAAARSRTRSLLETEIDREFDGLISSAISEEEREVEATAKAFARAVAIVERISLVLLVLAVPVSLLMLAYLTRIFGRGVEAIDGGVEAFAEGRLDHRVARLEDRDFDRIGSRFNDMADMIRRDRLALQQANAELEATVAERTRDLVTSAEKLSEVDEARRRLFADISHELRTPLTVIRGEAEIALRGEPKLAEEYRASLGRVVDQAAHMTRLVDDLLFIARSDSGEVRLDMRSVAIVRLLETAIADFEPAAAEKGVVIRRQIDAKDVVVRGDAGRLRQVLAILLDNAIRYSNPAGEVRIFAQAGVGGFVIRIEDDGIGIPSEELGRVFDRFYRGSGAQRIAEGTGLGLPVAKAIIEAHQGGIRLDSGTRGAVATVTLPVESRLRAVS